MWPIIAYTFILYSEIWTTLNYGHPLIPRHPDKKGFTVLRIFSTLSLPYLVPSLPPSLTVSRCFPNRQFWSEWSSFRDTLSAELLDFFNSIFVLCSAHRGVLRDLARHSWISSGVRLSPDEIVTHMKER